MRETCGTIRLEATSSAGCRRRSARGAARAIQYVHQDPGAALDPWWSIGHALDEALRIHGVLERDERQARRRDAACGRARSVVPARAIRTSCRAGSSGASALARILVLKPRIVILDEPTSGLDLSVQATVLGLLDDLRKQLGLTYLFVCHDLSVVQRMCEHVAIMYLGRIVETAPTAESSRAAASLYARAAGGRPEAGAGLAIDAGMPCDPPPRTWCRVARSARAASTPSKTVPRRCRRCVPTDGADHFAACIRWQELAAENAQGMDRRRMEGS